MGPLILRCSLPNDRREDNVSPHGASACQLSADRWILVYHTRSYRVVDEERSVLYQIREGTPDGRVLKEGLFAASNRHGDPNHIEAHGHAAVWGVPQGAVRDGKVLPHGNLFCARWYAKPMTVTPGNVRGDAKEKWVEWVQFRLDASGNDIEILEAVSKIDSGHVSLAGPVPLDPDGTRWADVCRADEGGVRTVQYVFDESQGRYRMAGKGAAWGADVGAVEGSLASHGRDALLAARMFQTGGVALARSRNPFESASAAKVVAPEIGNLQKLIYRCADDKVRLFSGRGGRSVAYCWDVDPVELTLSSQRVVWDSQTLKAPFDDACGRVVDVYVVFPHAGGREQYVAYGFRPKALDHPYAKALVGDPEKDAAGVYYSKIVYSRAFPGRWAFPGDAER